ncbi:hypothetical protein amrb99_12350 [Actinomadura sp. RB99]|nr:NUDIX hydrolase [Actinomadura sp. RB99]MBD2892325.1 hypothetical protein [Actinomadura sp. RB99]
MLLTGPQRHVLLVKTHYRPDWGLPGGVAEDKEPPHLACAREICEEVGLARPAGPLLATVQEDEIADFAFLHADSVATGLVHLPRPGGGLVSAACLQCRSP